MAQPLAGGEPITVLTTTSLQSTLPPFSVSPNGKWIAYTSTESGNYEVLRSAISKRRGKVAGVQWECDNWSRNSDYVYVLHDENDPAVVRVRLRDHKVERVADLKNFRQAGFYNVWLSLAPDDSPLLLRDTGTQEIYALDWQVPY